MKKIIFMALMAGLCLTANAKGDKKEKCDTAKCCQRAPIPGLDLSDEDKAKLQDIFGRYMEEIKNAHGDLAKTCCEKPADGENAGPEPKDGMPPIDENMAVDSDGDKGPQGRPEGGPRGDKPGQPGKQLSDEEAEAMIKAQISTQREILNIKEKYYDEFRTVLTPAQILIIYNQDCNAKQQQRGNRQHGGPQGGPGNGPRPQMR